MRNLNHLPTAHIDLDCIAHNYALLSKLSATASIGDEAYRQALLPCHAGGAGPRPFTWPSQLAVIKADAYGHGLLEVSTTLFHAGARLFAAGSVQEACLLSQHLASLADSGQTNGQKPTVISLLGFISADDIALCQEHDIIPLLHSFEQLDLLSALESPLAVAIKCNSGMSRLGFNETDIEELKHRLQANPRVTPVLAMSHLHSAGQEDGWLKNQAQAFCFKRMLEALRQSWPQLAASLANTAGICHANKLHKIIGPQICRIGLGLYGLSPLDANVENTCYADLRPAMSVSTPILALRSVKANEGISYGHTFITEQPMTIALAGIGYADGLPLAMSNRGFMNVTGIRAGILGQVCMQITALNISALSINNGKQPDKVWVLGGPYPDAITAEEIAEICGTHVYDILCMMGCNQRVYGSGSRYS